MSDTNYFRLIEAYFEGTISASERALLDMQLTKDPLLKGEFDLQKDIKQGITEYRKAQLKSRLNALDVPQPIQFLPQSTINWLASTIIAASSIGILFYYLSGDSNTIIPVDITSTGETTLVENPRSLKYPTITKKVEASQEFTSINKEPAFIKTKIEKSSISSAEKIDVDSKPEAKVNPQSLLSFEDEHLFDKEAENINKVNSIQIGPLKENNTNIEVKSAFEEEKYHYQYFNNKLYLYGNYSKEPYELIELNSSGNKQLYLSYDNKIFHLQTSIKEITEMKAIKNKQLISEIKLLLSN